MYRTRLAVLAAVLCAGAATPALADWDSIGSVHVSRGRDHDVRMFDLGGPVDRISLRAEDNAVECRSVTATFGNGNTRQIFSGRLYENRPTAIDLPGNNRDVGRLSFDCSAGRWRDATIRIAADIGSHRGEWQRNPNFGRMWAHVFNWGSNAMNDWSYAGQVRFVGRHDDEQVFTGWRGRNTDSIALKPVNAGARCRRVTATFGNGRTRELDVNNGDYMRQGQFYKLDLPGDRRNVTSLNLRCRATDARRVTIQIFTGR
ncbi:MAG TPA: hypothetical protein VLT91_00980 [Rhizomicrobium sp.]|nr:hypothetical protein [Rhizomicrobium sp.]